MGRENSLDYTCDWRFGFNLDPRAHGTLGYLLFWSGCGGLSLTKDVKVWNPFNSAGQTIVTGDTIPCIGIIESFTYEGGAEDPIRIVAYVSKDTAANVRAKLASPLTSTSVQVSWYIIDYDDDRKQWYEAAFVQNNAKAQANIDTDEGEIQLFISNEPTRIGEHLTLKVYKLEFQIVPANNATTTLQFATGSTQKLVKIWGDAGG